MALFFDTVELTGSVQIGNTSLTPNGSMVRHNTANGYIELGPANTSHAHIQTDRSNFYFNTEIRVDSGIIGSYNEDLFLRRAGSNKIIAQTDDVRVLESLKIEESWDQGTFPEQLTIQGSYPSITLRNNSQGHKWLMHHDGGSRLQFYEGNTWNNNTWTRRFAFRNSGDIEITKTSGPMIVTGASTDAFGYNSNYGHYIAGNGGTYVYGNGSIHDGTANRTILHSANYNSYTDNRYLRRYTGSASGVDNTGYTTAFTVNGDNLASSIRFSVQGTTGSVVVSNLVDLVVNHSQDIMIKAQSGVYTRLIVKVVSNNNEDFAVELKTNSPNAVTLYLEVFAYGDESVTFTNTHSFTGSSIEHECLPGYTYSGTGGAEADIKTNGDISAGGRVYVGTGGGNFYNDASSRVRIDQDFYTNNSNTYLYANNLYLGNTSGDNVHVRGNYISGNNWYIGTDGGARFKNIDISGSLSDTIQNKTAGGNLWLQYGHNGPIGLGYGGGKTTMYAKAEVIGTANGNDPTLRVTSTTSNTYNHAIECFNSNLTSGEKNIVLFGRTGDNRNAGYIGYHWEGASNNNNYVTIGHWSFDNLFRVYPDQILSTVSHRASVDMRAPIFYDYNDTSNYINPNGTSVHKGVQFNLGSSSNWDTGNLDGFNTTITNLHFQGHADFWIGAGNSYWHTTPIAGHHDLIINTMQAQSGYERGITFTASKSGSAYRLGRWFSKETQADSILEIDGRARSGGSFVNTQHKVRNIDSDNYFNINDNTTVDEFVEQWGSLTTGSISNITKVDDNTAPAPGCFQFAGPTYIDSSGDYIKVDQNAEYTFECWIKYVSGTGTDCRLYLGWNMYNSGKSSFGNVQRYWGASAFQVDANSNNNGWYKVTGTISGIGTATGQFISGTQYVRPLFLINYVVSGTVTTRLCGFKLYKSDKQATELTLTRKGYKHGYLDTTENSNPPGYVRLSNHGGDILKIQSDTGYVNIGSINASYAHFNTDRGGYYFDKNVHFDGVLYDYDNTNYYLNPYSNSQLQTLSMFPSTNGVGAKINFSDHAAGGYTQYGILEYLHADTASYGAGNCFKFYGTEANMTFHVAGRGIFQAQTNTDTTQNHTALLLEKTGSGNSVGIKFNSGNSQTGFLYLGGTGELAFIESLAAGQLTKFIITPGGRGSVGIGGINPNYRLHVYDGDGLGTASLGNRAAVGTTVQSGAALALKSPGAGGSIALDLEAQSYGSAAKMYFPQYSSGMTVTNGGTVSQNAFAFMYSSSSVGSIRINSTSTSYNTTSDYRLKENVTPITGAIERLNQLNPSRFTWISDPEAGTVDGFIAHEVSDVVPEAVSGEKDGVDYLGMPEYQGIDQSKLVPLLTAALQEAIAKIESLEARIQVLENQ